jgi:DNA gyrase/topoisomerase IV subunit A
MENQSNTKANSSLVKILSLVIAILAILNVYLFVKLNSQKETTQEKVTEILQITQENDSVKAELMQYYEQYNQIKTNNDSLNQKLAEEQTKIKELIDEISSNKSQIRSYKKELKTVREVLQSYVHQIDSLQQKNQVLVAENKEAKKLVEKISSEKDELVETKKSLEEKVDIASSLKATNFMVDFFRSKGRATKYADKVEKISVCFKVLENTIATSGEIPVYMRIARPDEMVLFTDPGNLFSFEEKEIAYSAYRVIEYFNQTMDVCIFYENKEPLAPGTYEIDIFAEGKLIGTTSFVLK